MKYLPSNFKFLFLCVSVFFLPSCNKNNKGEWIVSDASRDTVLIAETKVNSPNTLILEISGWVNDSIEVYSMRLAGGKIRQEFQLDHYSPKISVQFKSYKATKGRLRIKYYLPSAF